MQPLSSLRAPRALMQQFAQCHTAKPFSPSLDRHNHNHNIQADISATTSIALF
jgi:hypothetical protein